VAVTQRRWLAEGCSLSKQARGIHIQTGSLEQKLRDFLAALLAPPPSLSCTWDLIIFLWVVGSRSHPLGEEALL
jgi:hypothetical protein